MKRRTLPDIPVQGGENLLLIGRARSWVAGARDGQFVSQLVMGRLQITHEYAALPADNTKNCGELGEGSPQFRH